MIEDKWPLGFLKQQEKFIGNHELCKRRLLMGRGELHSGWGEAKQYMFPNKDCKIILKNDDNVEDTKH